MADITADSNVEYPVFKGLQRPLEFMGLQGRYIVWAAVTVGATFLGFIAAYFMAGFLAGIIVLTVCLGTGGVTIFVKQHMGLYSKKMDRGLFIIHKRYNRF